jgi:hypothetical protein
MKHIVLDVCHCCIQWTVYAFSHVFLRLCLVTCDSVYQALFDKALYFRSSGINIWRHSVVTSPAALRDECAFEHSNRFHCQYTCRCCSPCSYLETFFFVPLRTAQNWFVDTLGRFFDVKCLWCVVSVCNSKDFFRILIRPLSVCCFEIVNK